MKKNVVITGTSRGIGYELVALFANEGHNVLALSRNDVPVSGMGITNCHCFVNLVTFRIYDILRLKNRTNNKLTPVR